MEKVKQNGIPWYLFKMVGELTVQIAHFLCAKHDFFFVKAKEKNYTFIHVEGYTIPHRKK